MVTGRSSSRRRELFAAKAKSDLSSELAKETNMINNSVSLVQTTVITVVGKLGLPSVEVDSEQGDA